MLLVTTNQIQVTTKVQVRYIPRIIIALGALDAPPPLLFTIVETFMIEIR